MYIVNKFGQGSEVVSSVKPEIVDASGTIKACNPPDKEINADGWTNVIFPSDGSKPYGLHIAYFLTLTNKLNLELVVEKGKDYNECTEKMRSGEIDLMTNLSDKDDRRDYMILIPFLQCSKLKWDCPGNQQVNFGISKKSKFISRIAEFKSAVSSKSEDGFFALYNTPFTSANSNEMIMVADYWKQGSEVVSSVKPEIVDASGPIKSCFANYYNEDGQDMVVRFPDDGGKPYGTAVEHLIILIKSLNLYLEMEKGQGEEIIVKGKRRGDYKLDMGGIHKCLEKMKTGEVDIMTSLSLGSEKIVQYADGRKETIKEGLQLNDYDYDFWKENIHLIEYQKNTYFGLSKKSKYSNLKGKIENMVVALRNIQDENLAQKFKLSFNRDAFEYASTQNFSSADDHDWASVYSPAGKSDLVKLLDTKRCPKCELSGANLSGKDLEEANLSGANLTGANLTKTILTIANLSGANLTDANLTGAVLGTTNLEGANLTGANFTGANLYNAKLSGVIIDKKVASTHESILAVQKGRQGAEDIKNQKESGEYDLLLFYASYQNLGKCFDARKGYMAVHVNAIEMKAIKSNAKKIQDGIYKKYPALEAEQDRIWNDSVKESMSKELVAMAFMFQTALIGSIEITNNFSDWNEICKWIKKDYDGFNKKYGGGGEAKKKDF